MKILLLFYSNNIFIIKSTNAYLIKRINFLNILKNSGGADPSFRGARPTLREQLPPLTGPNDVPVAQCSETNEKSIFQFLGFEIQFNLCSKFSESSNYFDQNNRPNISIFFLSQKICNIQKRMQKPFSDFQFMRYGRFWSYSTQKWPYLHKRCPLC